MYVALVIQHAKRMRRTNMSSVASPAAYTTFPYFSTLYHKWHDFRGKKIETRIVFSFSVQLLSETFLVLRRIQRDINKNVNRASCKVPVILVRL